MALGGVLGDRQPASDLGVRETKSQKIEDLRLPTRQIPQDATGSPRRLDNNLPAPCGIDRRGE
jgi:hypothetical protein